MDRICELDGDEIVWPKSKYLQDLEVVSDDEEEDDPMENAEEE